jgi:hypothetical protein
LASRDARPPAAALRLPTVRLAAAGSRAAPRVAAAASAARPAPAPRIGVLRRTVRLEQGDGGRGALVRGVQAARGSQHPAAAPARKARR